MSFLPKNKDAKRESFSDAASKSSSGFDRMYGPGAVGPNKITGSIGMNVVGDLPGLEYPGDDTRDPQGKWVKVSRSQSRKNHSN